ncbi:hypothetical protein [Streptomyces sp. NPDC005533]|uniref:hypothetical protein n=1 Tax=Streptomyces sp. NPDC005533 TaxID=3364723 RepID=UPI003675983F
MTPAGRQWPSAVYEMLTAQRARIDGLLGGGPAPEPVPSPPAPEHTPTPTPVPTPTPAPVPVPVPEDDRDVALTQDAPPPVPKGRPVPPRPTEPPTGPSPVSRSPWRGRRRITALVAAAVLLVAGTGVVAYVRDRMNSPVAYKALPTCQDVHGQLPLQRPVPSLDTRSEEAWGVRTGCSWNGLGQVTAPRALVRWELSLGGDAAHNADAQRARFRVDTADKTEAPNLTFGTEAYWGSPSLDWTCTLVVREGNLSVWVGLYASPYRTSECQDKAKAVARAALKATPR